MGDVARALLAALTLVAASAGCSSASTASGGRELPRCPSVRPLPTAGALGWAYEALAVPEAWRWSTGRGVLVAVVDTPVADLGELRAVRDHRGGGFPSAARGEDDHGTAMAVLVHRVAPEAQLLVVPVLAQDGGSEHDLARGIRFAVARGARVVSVSATVPAQDGELADAVGEAARRGVLVVAAAGNDQADLDQFPTYPAALPAPNLVAVAAVDREGRPTGGTNVGRHAVDVAAPGLEVPSRRGDGSSWTVTGSSPATALTAGTAALVLGAAPALDARGVRAVLLRGARPVRGLADAVASAGRLDAGRSVEAAVVLDCARRALAPTAR